MFNLISVFDGFALFSMSDLNSQLKYDNFDFSSHTISFGVALLCAFLGVFIAILFNLFRNMTSGKAVRALLKSDSTSKEKAKTPKELGFSESLIIRYALRNGAYLRNIVYIANEAPKANKFGIFTKPDFENIKLYIPEEKNYKASEQYKRKGNDLPAAIFSTIILIVTFFLVLYQLPNLLDFIDSIIG